MVEIPPHAQAPDEELEDPASAVHLGVNELVSYNLLRARKARGWTQQQFGGELKRYTGRAWSNASVSAAERAWQGGRPRKFDADEIAAFSMIFGLPFSYFLLPPLEGDPPVGSSSADEDELKSHWHPASLEYLKCVLAVDPTPEFTDRVQDIVSKYAALDFVAAKWEWNVSQLPSDSEIQEVGAGEWEDSTARGVVDKAAEEVGTWASRAEVPAEVLHALTRARSKQISYEVAKQLNAMGYLRDPEQEEKLKEKEDRLDRQLEDAERLLHELKLQISVRREGSPNRDLGSA